MTKEELSLILFLETQATDRMGRVNGAHMNKEDFEIAKKWNDDGFIEFGRIQSKDITKDGAHYVCLSDEAFKAAHNERQAKAKRTWLKRVYLTVDEKRNSESMC